MKTITCDKCGDLITNRPDPSFVLAKGDLAVYRIFPAHRDTIQGNPDLCIECIARDLASNFIP